MLPGRIQVLVGGLYRGLEECSRTPGCQGEPLAGLDGSAEAWVYQEKKKKNPCDHSTDLIGHFLCARQHVPGSEITEGASAGMVR